MRRAIIRASLLSALLLILVMVGAANAPLLAQQEQQKGLFGRVTGITTPSPGLTVIILNTITEDQLKVEAAENTLVSFPGRETASAADISPGDFLAVLAQVDEDRLQAMSILVKPEVPVLHTHITGALVGAVGDQISIMDRDGNVIAADLLLKSGGIDPAQVVTAVVRQDLKAGSLSILGSESADTKIERLGGALKSAVMAGAGENEENLKSRLRASTTGHLTTLQKILNRVDPDLIGVFFTQARGRSLQSHEALLAAFDLGAPTVKLAGVIEDIDRTVGRGIAFVFPREGPSVQLKLTEATNIREFGMDAREQNLQLGQQIEFIYDPQTGEAHTIDVIFPSLADNLIRSLLAQVEMREFEGTISEVNPSATPPVVVIRLDSGKTITLTTTSETNIKVREEPAGLQDLAEALVKTVKVRYDPSTMEALDIETFDLGQAFIWGVVKGFIPKIRQGIKIPGSAEEGNISIVFPEGETITLNITERTIIERDGLRTNIGAIKLGDLVRPVSRLNSLTREVQRLVLNTPTLQGTIGGKVTTPAGRDYLTISTDQLNLVTVTVADATVDFATLEVGERVVSGLYNPGALQVSQLVVRPPKPFGQRGLYPASTRRRAS